jgi:hypothetical protein
MSRRTGPGWDDSTPPADRDEEPKKHLVRLPYRADRIPRRRCSAEDKGAGGGDGALRASVGGEREKEERRRGRPLGALYGSDSPVLDRRLADASKDRPSGYAADLSTMHRLMSRGVHSQGDAYRFHGLKARYREEYAVLEAEARGQGELL